MRLTRIRLRNFRNHGDTQIEFGDGANLVRGNNGQGKTNILEAIGYLCLTKSFYAQSDAVVVRFGKEGFEVEGNLISDNEIECDVRVAYDVQLGEKVYAMNKRRIEPFSSIIGRFPVVVLSPEYGPITSGGPSDRRKFVDMALSQASAVYFQDLLEYRRVLKQRNKILADSKLEKSNPSKMLEPWDEQMTHVGARLVYRRRQFVEQFQSYMQNAYRQFVDAVEEPAIEYAPLPSFGSAEGEADIAALFAKAVEEKRRDEIRVGTSLVGPHRDEFLFTLDSLELRKFASQGQHKTFLVALKIGEFFYLKQRHGETPMFLMDDVFSELDEHRIKRVLGLVEELGQTFITSTDHEALNTTLMFDGRNRKFVVSNGTVEYESISPQAT